MAKVAVRMLPAFDDDDTSPSDPQDTSIFDEKLGRYLVDQGFSAETAYYGPPWAPQWETMIYRLIENPKWVAFNAVVLNGKAQHFTLFHKGDSLTLDGDMTKKNMCRIRTFLNLPKNV